MTLTRELTRGLLRFGRAVAVFLLALALVLVGVGARFAVRERTTVAAATKEIATNTSLNSPDAVCAGCHREIYTQYERTSMARGSGLARDGLIEGQFRHAPSGIAYSVSEKDGKPTMSYDRPGMIKTGVTLPPLHGERSLVYFIGSGHRGRTYLYEVDGQWFELPINFYGKLGLWDMAPNYEGATAMPDPLPVDSNCLHCHATDVQVALPEAKNRYPGVPFKQGGIGCSGCHGDASKHLAQGGHGPILNPDKLLPTRRDDICLQCHLEGDAVVNRPGRSLAQFKPGDRLSDDAMYFVRASAEMGGRRATSQYEALLRSACKAGSGDHLTCTTCHDPHASPAPAERVTFFRARCLSCHSNEKIALQHHPEQQDCASCHMPTRATSDISHEQVTDHDIQRVHQDSEKQRPINVEIGDELKPVGTTPAGDRELGLAYAQMAERGDRKAAVKALTLLSRAEADGASDAPLHAQLGYLSQISGQTTRAASEYTIALGQSPFETSALGNLAVLAASGGRTDEAVSLLRRLLTADPAQTSAGLNLAYIECRLGQRSDAREILHQLQALSPDNAQVRTFLESGLYAGQQCKLQ